MDGELDLGLPESPWRWFDVRFTAGAQGITPTAPGHPAVAVAYSAELAEAVVRVRARSEEGARLRAEGLCSGLEWVARAAPEVTPVPAAGPVR